MKTHKAVPVVLRQLGNGLEVLVFEHPQAGTQIVKGTVELDESIEQAAVRELAEESGITGAICVRDLGIWEQCPAGQVWHFREMTVPCALPDAWSQFSQDGGGHVFSFSWHPLAEPAPVTCHQVFVDALNFIRQRMSGLTQNFTGPTPCAD
jgi:8-oxo-dGTP pyrophosphatase MutT (NUDIX family)